MDLPRNFSSSGEPSKAAVASENDSDNIPLKGDSEDGSLKEDQALQTYKIPDEDERWELLDPSGGLKKIVLKSGKGVCANKGELVSFHFSGFVRDNGKMFLTSYERGDINTFEIGGTMLKGWDKGIATMQPGEYAILRCRADFAYGERGCSPHVQPNATVDFVIRLKSIQRYKPVKDTYDAKKTISKKTIKEVEGSDTAGNLWLVTVTYTGRENDEHGRIWCSGIDQKVKIPFDEEFDSKGVIPEYDQPRGFYVCLKETKKGEVNYFKLQSNNFYTFGSTGSEKFNIASNTDLFYEITITEMVKFTMISPQLDWAEKIPKSLELKDIANDFFRRKKFTAAKKIYEEILSTTTNMDAEDSDDEKINMISLACYTNMALVETQMNNLTEAYEQVDMGLLIDPKHEKLRYRQAFLKFKLGDFEFVGKLLLELTKEFPENKAIKVLALKNTRAIKELDKKSKKLARKMFGPSAGKKLKNEIPSQSDTSPTVIRDEPTKSKDGDMESNEDETKHSISEIKTNE